MSAAGADASGGRFGTTKSDGTRPHEKKNENENNKTKRNEDENDQKTRRKQNRYLSSFFYSTLFLPSVSFTEFFFLQRRWSFCHRTVSYRVNLV